MEGCFFFFFDVLKITLNTVLIPSSGLLSAARSRLSSMGGLNSTVEAAGDLNSSVLIKHFRVRWLNSKSQLFVAPKGVAVVSAV